MGRTETFDAPLLATLVGRLAAAARPDDVYDAVTVLAGPIAGFDHADVSVLRDGRLRSTQRHWPFDRAAAERYAAVDPDDKVPTAEAARRGEIVLVEDLAEFHPSLREDAQRAGVVSVAAVPLRDLKGDVLGVFWLAARRRVDFDDDTRAVITILAETCGAAIRRIHIAERAGQMAGLAGRLSGAVTAVDVAEALRDNGHQALGATLVNLRLLDTERKNLEALVASPLPVPLAARYTSVPIDAPYPLSEAARTNRPVFIGDVDEFSRRYPDAAADAVTAGYQATASIPIHDSAGAVTGVLAVAWRSPVAFDDLIRAATLTIADLVGQTLDRARLTDSEHELVATLQRRLLGTVAPPPGVDLVTRYLPAAHDVGIGGDFFDVVTHDHGFSLTVGDVTGHGVEAVTTMAQLRTLISGLLRAGEPLESLFGRVQSMLDRGDRVLASAEVFDIDPVGGRLRYCSAGHPWALLRRVGGDVVVLDAGRQGLIGLPPVDPVVAEVDVQAGDVLVAYTDGLVERRGEVITTGLDRLADSLRGMPEGGALEEIADTLLCACGIDPQAPTELADDVALVVVRIGT